MLLLFGFGSPHDPAVQAGNPAHPKEGRERMFGAKDQKIIFPENAERV